MQDERVASPDTDTRANAGIWPQGGLRAALRALRPLVGARAIDAAGSATPLERFAMAGDPPAVATCSMLEEPGTRRIEVGADVGVDAFLDGIQR
ncbi:MAG: hypothetical protein ABMA00_07955, partial [Gemmatimonas sp.]